MWLQEKQTGVKNTQQNGMMLWMMPVISLWIGFSLPAGLTLYWIAGNIIGILQEFYVSNHLNKQKEKAPSKEVVSSNDKNRRNNRKNH
jgi:YidC/Oxa1 family membrane protein insertase